MANVVRYILGGLVAAIPAVLAVTGATAQTRETHGDFEVFCRADLYCIAETAMRSSDGLSGIFKLERGGDAGGRVFVTAAPARALTEGMRIDMDVHGTGLDRITGIYGPVRKIYPGNEMTFAHNPDDGIIDWIRRGEVIDVTADHPGARDVYRASLSGATAALLAFDRLQGRIGRRDAIVAYGPAPAGEDTAPRTIPPLAASTQPDRPSPERAPVQPVAAPIPSVVGIYPAYDINEVRNFIPDANGSSVCNYAEAIEGVGAWIAEFEGGGGLYTIPCLMADLNFTFVVGEQLGANAAPRAVRFVMPDGGEQSLPLNASFDPDAGTIETTEYYGPDGDCGRLIVFRYRPGASPLAPSSIREKTNCDGVTVSPLDWPLVSSN